MLPQVLIVDDDQSWLTLLSKELESYAASFTIRTAASAESALALLRREHIMLVISDLRMPGMDGFELLSQILEHFPDIPVIIVTGYDRPKTKDVVFRSGASGYLIKPFATDKLAREISKMLNKKAEGGNLHNVSLETFLQLVEMEQQTCTLQVINKAARTGGVLFFREGELVNARIHDRQGKAAAYEILSWSNVSVSIENNCVFEEKIIEGDLQAILLDAMRSKDENEENARQNGAAAEETAGVREGAADEPAAADADAGMDSGADSSPAEDSTTDAADTAAGENPSVSAPNDSPDPPEKTSDNDSAVSEPPEEELSPAESIRRRLTRALGNYSGVEDVYTDDGWNSLLSESTALGEAFGFGPLNVFYASKVGKRQYLVVPGEETTVIAITPDASRDRIISAVS